MNNLFRQVKCSERLPNKFGMYICLVKIKVDGLHYQPATYCQWDSHSSKWTDPNVNGIKGEVVVWHEPVKIPTYEEIENMAANKYPGIPNPDGDEDTHGYNLFQSRRKDGFMQGFKTAIKHLTGGK